MARTIEHNHLQRPRLRSHTRFGASTYIISRSAFVTRHGAFITTHSAGRLLAIATSTRVSPGPQKLRERHGGAVREEHQRVGKPATLGVKEAGSVITRPVGATDRQGGL